MKIDDHSIMKCFMCGSHSSETGKLLGGIDGFICEPCIHMAHEVVKSPKLLASPPDNVEEATRFLTSDELKMLDRRFGVAQP